MQKVLSSLYKSYKQKWFYNLVSTKFGVPKMIYLCNNASCINIRIHSHCVKSVQIRSFFRSVFSSIWTEYGDLWLKSPYSVRILENTDQKKLRIWTRFTQ